MSTNSSRSFYIEAKRTQRNSTFNFVRFTASHIESNRWQIITPHMLMRRLHEPKTNDTHTPISVVAVISGLVFFYSLSSVPSDALSKKIYSINIFPSCSWATWKCLTKSIPYSWKVTRKALNELGRAKKRIRTNAQNENWVCNARVTAVSYLIKESLFSFSGERARAAHTPLS